MRTVALLMTIACGPLTPQGTPAAPPPTALTLTVPPWVIAGGPMLAAVSGASPGVTVHLGASTALARPGWCPRALAPTCLDLGAPVTDVAQAAADTTGVAALSVSVPAWPLPPQVELQAVSRVGGATQLSAPALVRLLDPAADEDADGLDNAGEAAIGADPLRADTDGDGMPDGFEVAHGRDPLAAPIADVSVDVDPAAVAHPDPRRLLGVSFDLRTSGTLRGAPIGYYAPDGTLRPEAAAMVPATLGAPPTSWDAVTLTGMRIPGNAVDNVDWRGTIGPLAARTPQQLSPAVGGVAQLAVLGFGFAELMAMAEARGLPPSEVQVMVSLKPSATLADPLQAAADQVEYANAPVGTNPGGGVAWADVRAANGHPEPYDVRTWNIGNEPWGPAEPWSFQVAGNAAAFAAVARQYAGAMLAIDPTIHLTLPTPRNCALAPPTLAAFDAWEDALHASLGADLWGLSVHMFYDTTSTRGVGACSAALDRLHQRLAAVGAPQVKVLLGDHAFAPSIGGAPIPPDQIMQWSSTVTTVDFLAMLAGRADVELANFWIFGVTQATWHPVRRNADGTLQQLPLAAMYGLLTDEIVGDDAAPATTAAPLSADGTGPAVRAAAFTRPGELTVLLVNRDSAAHTAHLAGLDGWTATAARQAWADTPNDDHLHDDAQPVAPGQRDLDLPARSVVWLTLAGP